MLVCISKFYCQENHTCAISKIKNFEKNQLQSRGSESQNKLMEKYDVHWYYLDLNVENNTTQISGSSSIGFKAISDIDTFGFELNKSLSIDSVLVDNLKQNFNKIIGQNFCHVILTNRIYQNENKTCKIYYKGNAGIAGNGAFGSGFNTAVAPMGGGNVVWSLSQPYAAADWFPCKQYLKDKADSAWINVTTNNKNKVGSNGVLIGIDSLPNNKVKYKWRTKYSIDYYLISISVAQYIEYNQKLVLTSLPNDTINIINYTYNQTSLNKYKPAYDSIKQFLEHFSNLWTPYPFYKEKYGHTCMPEGGAMEHQTMSSMGDFSFQISTFAHELAHQWFGDLVTCSTWSDIFINEGFATYGEYLALEKFAPPSFTKFDMLNRHDYIMSFIDGSVYVPDTTDIGRIFSYRLTYSKGAAVIHTLRYIMGDQKFFEGLKTFLTDYSFKNASIPDFKKSMEKSSGLKLDSFFSQWIYGEGYPIYKGKYNYKNDTVYLIISHTTSFDLVTKQFTTPLEVQFNRFNNTPLIRKLTINTKNDSFIIPISSFNDTLEFDPNNWIINKHVGFVFDSTIKFNPKKNTNSVSNTMDKSSILIYPNPIKENIFIKNFTNFVTDYILTDISGKILKELKSKESELEIKINDLPNGVYFLNTASIDFNFHYKLIKE